MFKNNKIQILSDCSNVTARFLKYFGTSILNVVTIERFFVPVQNMSEEGLLREFIACGVLAGIAGTVEASNIIYSHSKKIAKAYKALLKSERFLDFIMLFRMIYNATYSLSEQQNLAIAVSAGITLPFASWRAYKSKRYWIENPITLFLARNIKDVELGAFPLPRQISSHRFSLQAFSEFKRLHETENIESDPQEDRELLREYFNTQIMQRHPFSRYILMDSLSYGAEIAGVVGYVMFTIDTLMERSNPILNFGIAAFLFIAGTLVGYRIEKIKDLLFDIYTSDFTRDQGLQNSIHELLIDLYANVTINVRRFAKAVEFVKNMTASFIGLQFVYVALSGGIDVPDIYTGIVAIVALLVGTNSIYNVQRQQDEMLVETGAKNALERLESGESGAVVETEDEPPAAHAQSITTPPKSEKSDVAGQPLSQGNGSPESSVSSSDSDSPPRSLPNRSPPLSLERPEEASSVHSAPGDLLMERRGAAHKKPRGWFDGWSSFFGSGSRRSEKVEGLRAPLVPPDERSCDLEVANGMLVKPA